MLTTNVLAGPRLKVQRAYRHIDELRGATEPLHPSLYQIRIDRECIFPDFQSGIYVQYYPLAPISELLAVVIGDAVHNLRSALDHVATGICRSVRPGVKEHFPIHPHRRNLETAPVLSLMEEALPGAKSLILDEIRPEDGPNECLWRFNDLNNDDKHNLLIPNVAVTTVEGLDFHFAGGVGRVFDNQFSFNAARPSCMEALEGFSGEVTINNNPTVTVDVRFSQGTPFENQPVAPTLVQVGNLVSETLDAFERLMRKNRPE